MTELKTGVDQLMALVAEKKKLPLQEAAKILNVPEKTLQAWVDFLVEEHILGIEYKFTTPYIYVHSDERLKKVQEEKKEENLTLRDFQDEFYDKARAKGMPEEKIPKLWREHLLYIVQGLKQYFIDECNKRNVKNAQSHYAAYVQELVNGA